MAAARLISKTGRVTAYLPNMNAAVKHFRTFSTIGNKNQYKLYCSSDDGEQTVWPNELGPFGPQDKRLPLPGYVGLAENYKKTETKKAEPVDIDALFENLPEVKQSKILGQVEDTVRKYEEENYLPDVSSPADSLECVAHECPVMLKNDFQTLFPHYDLTNEKLTVITVSNKTINDMTGWSVEVEEEREKLLQAFVEGATEICNSLTAAGFWADFIDPSSGKPYLGPHTNATFFETDERYRKFGFEIDDLGCCKVIRHHIWGTHSYVGCLFTNAPLDHPIISDLMLL